VKPKDQGKLGEKAAATWLLQKNAGVFFPFPEHSDIDLIAVIEGQMLRIQVKTTTCREGARWKLQLCTRGGNQSWNGSVKYLDSSRCDYVFALVGDGRQWFIPACALGGRAAIRLGGPKYAEFEVEPWWPLSGQGVRALLQSGEPGECPSGQRERAVNASAQPTQVRILPPP
jgi:hypothetical protein